MSFINSEIPRVRLPSGATQNGLNSKKVLIVRHDTWKSTFVLDRKLLVLIVDWSYY